MKQFGISVTSNRKNVQAFGSERNKVLASMSERPLCKLLESMYRLQLDGSEELKYVVRPSDETLKQFVQKDSEQKMKDSQFKKKNPGAAEGNGQDQDNWQSSRLQQSRRSSVHWTTKGH